MTSNAALTAQPTGLVPARSSERSADRFRPEIQGLRALAVILVVVFHLYPNRVPGGFVGVDVFFVISGFLITAHLHRELVSTGTVALRRFWGAPSASSAPPRPSWCWQSAASPSSSSRL